MELRLALALAQRAGEKSFDSDFPPTTGIGSMKLEEIFAQTSVRPVHLVRLATSRGKSV